MLVPPVVGFVKRFGLGALLPNKPTFCRKAKIFAVVHPLPEVPDSWASSRSHPTYVRLRTLSTSTLFSTTTAHCSLIEEGAFHCSRSAPRIRSESPRFS